MLLNGYGYNWYRLDNQMRADDLLVRSRASEHLESAAARLRDPERHYRRFVAQINSRGAVGPRSDILREANVLRPPKLEHAVQRGDSNGHLGHLPPFGP